MNYCSYIQCNNTRLLKQRARSVLMTYTHRKDAQDTVLSENESCRSFVYNFNNLHTHTRIHTHTCTHTPMCAHLHIHTNTRTHTPHEEASVGIREEDVRRSPPSPRSSRDCLPKSRQS